MPSMTKLDAVNACLAAINEYRVTALDTGGTSITAEAERYVDDSTRYFCAMGFPCNTLRAKGYVPVAPGNTITLSSDTLRIRSAGPDQHRNLVQRGNSVWDADKGQFDMGSTNTVYLDVAELLAFADLDPMLREQVAQRAAQQFARRTTGSQLSDAYLSQELAITDTMQPRDTTFGNRPIFAQTQPQQQQQQG